MTSVVEICNLALTRIGVQTINSLTEASAQALDCNLFYGPARDALLRQVPWRFAHGRQALALLTETPPPEWTYVYAQPSDMLAARYIEPTGPVIPHGAIYRHGVFSERVPTGSVVTAMPTLPTAAFELRGQKVFTHQPDAVLIYTARIEDPTLFDPSFVEALSYRLAADLAISRKDDRATRDMMLRDYQGVLAAATAADARDGTVRADLDPDWMRARG